MTAPLPGLLQDAESDLQTAQSESDPHRQGQYARAAADAAAEVAMNAGASAEDRERALVIMRSSLTLIPGSLLGEAQSMLTAARGEADPQRRRELARSALAKGREALRHREVTDEERAQGRQVIGGARMIVNTIVETAMRQQAADREHEHHTPSIAPLMLRPARTCRKSRRLTRCARRPLPGSLVGGVVLAGGDAVHARASDAAAWAQAWSLDLARRHVAA